MTKHLYGKRLTPVFADCEDQLKDGNHLKYVNQNINISKQ